ncbi:MAG TPA: C40 family peptidase [Streptosporangiaceae bacterium]
MRDGTRRMGPVLVAVAAVSVAAVIAGQPAFAASSPHSRSSGSGQLAAGQVFSGSVSLTAAYQRAIARNPGRYYPAGGGITAPPRSPHGTAVQVARELSAMGAPQVAPLRKLRQADLLVVAPTTLRPRVAAAIRALPGVEAVSKVDAATIAVNGKFIQMLGVDPSSFRAFAARPVARSTSLWRAVAAGDIAVSYTMGRQDHLPLGSTAKVAGQQQDVLRVGGYGTVGIAGVDAVVSQAVAANLGFPQDNALVISAPHAQYQELTRKINALLPRHAALAQLVAQVRPGEVLTDPGIAAGAAGAPAALTAHGVPMTSVQAHAFLSAALSRVGMPYVWGAAGPRAFDCSGLVQWSMRQAGLVMPRVAVDQARTGPRIPLSDLRPGDLLFYHTDPTAPTYISHVAIYLGNGLMLQAPEPGMDVEIVKAIFGAGFAGAVEVYPAVAAAVAADPAG